MKVNSKGPKFGDVLLVDDDPQILEYYEDILADSELFNNIITATDGSEGFRKIINQPFNLIIVDLSMPKMDGLKFITNIKHPTSVVKHKNIESIPIVIISGDVNQKSVKESIRLGVKHILLKPFTARTLLKKIKSALDLNDETDEGDK